MECGGEWVGAASPPLSSSSPIAIFCPRVASRAPSLLSSSADAMDEGLPCSPAWLHPAQQLPPALSASKCPPPPLPPAPPPGLQPGPVLEKAPPPPPPRWPPAQPCPSQQTPTPVWKGPPPEVPPLGLQPAPDGPPPIQPPVPISWPMVGWFDRPPGSIPGLLHACWLIIPDRMWLPLPDQPGTEDWCTLTKVIDSRVSVQWRAGRRDVITF